MRRYRPLLLLPLLLLSLGAVAAPRVVATILPVHSLVAAVMEGVGTPRLLLPAGASPHSYALLPSDAQVLAQAELIVWVGPDLEPFLQKPLRTLAGQAATIELTTLPDLMLLGADRQHAHAGHEAGDHRHDPHLWLDPANAAAIVEAVQARLGALDPANAAAYRANAARQLERLRALDREIRAVVAPVRSVRFLVFHDAYRYFTERYGLASVGALTLSPDRLPGARAVAAARDRVRSGQVRCVFREPQFEPSLAEAVVRGTGARTGTLDPIGADLPPGPDAYVQLLRNLAHSLHDCLAQDEERTGASQ